MRWCRPRIGWVQVCSSASLRKAQNASETQFAGPSAQRRVRSSTIVVVFIDLSIIFDIGAAPGTLEPCCGRLGAHLVTPRSVFGDPWAPTGRFLSIFRRPEAASKNQRFLQSPKIAPGAPKITLWAPKAPFLMDFYPFLMSFLASFFDVFAKRRKP